MLRKLRLERGDRVVDALDLAVFLQRNFALLLDFEGQIVDVGHFGFKQSNLERRVDLCLLKLLFHLLNLALVVIDFTLQPFVAAVRRLQVLDQRLRLAVLACKRIVLALKLSVAHVKVLLRRGEDIILLH